MFSHRARALDLADEYFHMDATDAVGMYNKAMELTDGELFDVVINCVNIENRQEWFRRYRSGTG